LLVCDRHRCGSTHRIALHDLIRAFGEQQVADAVGEINRIGDDRADDRLLVRTRRSGRRLQGIQRRLEPRKDLSRRGFPIRQQRDTIDDIARPDRFCWLVCFGSAAGAPRVCKPQWPDELGELTVS